jgi:tRNA-Thr(GGU) m(6)t(6)A37 methyltransferase TsaA
MIDYETRPGEIAAAIDPEDAAKDARLIFIGRIRSPWRQCPDCPKNLREAREWGVHAMIQIDSPWRPGLDGLDAGSHVVVLYWMDQARRDLIVQNPRHTDGPKGVFSLRSPIRPNPIALAVVKLLALDIAEGRLEIDAIDCLDGTPVLDIKPYIPGIDSASGVDPEP